LLKISKSDSNISENRLKSIRSAHTKKDGGQEQQQQHTDRMEDYLEVIYELIRQKGYATAIDISESLSVSSPSVTKMLQRLDENKYLRYEKYRGISLTREGITVAENIRQKHGLLADHPEILKKLEVFVSIVKNSHEFGMMRGSKR
jgi:transcription initiation factor IIE alpha subunit